MAKKAKDLEELVTKVLIENPFARDSDTELFFSVCMVICPNALAKPFGSVLRDFNSYGLPRFESIARIRRKVQAAFPELQGNRQVESWRKEKETEFREYARS